jgi:serine/threonine-protein kinase
VKLGRYEVLEPIGQGAMGAVYKARDPAIDRVVAVKTIGGVLLALAEQRDEYLERFRREARAAGRLSHPNIVPVFDLGVDEASGTPFIVMEHVAGVSLAVVLRENPLLPLDQALDIVEQIGRALEEAHGAGIVHRDIKPGNVLLDTRGRVKVGDFGIARLPESELTQTGVGMGTPGYVAPEVLKGAPADARADVFSLGVVAYQLVTGRKAFEGATRDSLALQILQHEPPAPRQVRPDLPAAVSDAIVHALAKDPERRTSSAAAFLNALRSPDGARSATQTVLSPAPPAGPSGGPRRALLLVGAALVALLGVAAWLATRDRAAEQHPPQSAASAPAPGVRPAAQSRPRATPGASASPTVHPAVEVAREILDRVDGADGKPEARPRKGQGKGKPKKDR